MVGTWRNSARPRIAEVLKATQGQSEKDIRKALRDAYPWGDRMRHPYKIWCDEIKVQRGFKKNKRFDITKNQINLF